MAPEYYFGDPRCLPIPLLCVSAIMWCITALVGQSSVSYPHFLLFSASHIYPFPFCMWGEARVVSLEINKIILDHYSETLGLLHGNMEENPYREALSS